MRIAVVGAGAVGGYFWARLAQGGAELVVLARGEHLGAIRREGLRIESVAGDVVVRPAVVTDDPAAAGQVEAVLLGTKSWQVPAAAAALGPLLAPGACVLPLQNGVEAPSQIARALGEGAALGGFCRILSYMVGPGVIRHAGIEPYVAFGELSGGPSDRAMRLLGEFRRSPAVTAELLPDIRLGMWRKFQLITAWGAVGALSGQPLGVLRARAETRKQLVTAMGEIESVARAWGVELGEGDVATTLAYLDAAPAEATTSMQRDLAEGRPSELDAQVGAVVRLAAERGIAVPWHRHALRVLEPVAREGG